MHPFAIATGCDDARVSKVGQMPGNLWLRLPQNLYEIADAQLLISHKVQKSQSGVIPERLKKALHVEGSLPRCHIAIIYALTHVFGKNIFI